MRSNSTIFVLLSLLPSALASDWDEFTNNLATDLAPLISLFGERLTKQFLSESTSILDNFTFAVAPLGILTAVVSLIRVCGNPSIRAFIGRAQEGPGEAEHELLSCVSETTAELFNNGGIARVFGKPQILEVVAWEDDSPEAHGNRSMNIGTLRDALKEEAWREKFSKPDLLSSKDLPELDIPNLSLNKGIKRRSPIWFYCAAALGTLLQIGVVVYSAITVYLFPNEFKKGGNAVPGYAFPLFLLGTAFLGIGMFLCAFILERSSREYYFHSVKPSKIYWLQPGGQAVGDQVFDPFLGVTEGGKGEASRDQVYIKSTRDQRFRVDDYQLLFVVAVTMVGFVLQFIGLRGLHASVILAQTGCTFLMAIVRTCLRTKRVDKDENKFAKEEQDRTSYYGQELDYFAFHLEGVKSFRLLSNSSKTGHEFPQPESSLSFDDGPGPGQRGARLLQTRARLAELTSGVGQAGHLRWNNIPIRNVARNLARTIEMTMDVLSSWRSTSDWSGDFEIAFECEPFTEKLVDTKPENYPINLGRSDDTLRWKVNERELEAVVGLWTWSMMSSNEQWPHSETYRLVGLNEAEARAEETDLYFHKWIFRQTEAKMVSSKMIDSSHQMFGCYDEYYDDKEILVVKTENTLPIMAAQDIYICFLKSVLGEFEELGGEVDIHPGSQDGFIAYSSRLEELVDCFESGNLGSREDALLCIVPSLIYRGLLPELAADSPSIRNRTQGLLASNRWTEAFAISRWLCERSEGTEFKQSLYELGLLYCSAMLSTNPGTRDIAFTHVHHIIGKDRQMWCYQEFRRSRPLQWLNIVQDSQDWYKFSQQLGWAVWHIAEKQPDAPSIHHTLQSIGVTEASLQSAAVNGNEDYTGQGERAVVQWLCSSSKSLSYDQTSATEVRLALDWVCQNSYDALLHWLVVRFVEYGKTHQDFIFQVLSLAAEGRYQLALMLLVRRGVNINMPDSDDGLTVLISKVVLGDKEAAHELLTAGADIDGRDVNGNTPLMAASHIGNLEMVLYLLRKGARVDAQDINGFNPLIWSTIGKHISVAQVLLEWGAQVNQGSLYNTPLMNAASEGHREMVELLLSHKADVNAHARGGYTALMMASKDKHFDTMKLLLEHGAFVDRTCESGTTALDWVRAARYAEGVELLEAAFEEQTGRIAPISTLF